MTPRSFWRCKRGQATAEYAVIVAIVVIVTAGAIRLLWLALNHLGQ